MNTSANNDDASIVGRELNGECVDREPQSPQSESIANWQLQEQPHYRLLHEGAEALANAELLALCLGSGVAGEDAVAVVLAHNHPSGSPEPSQADIQLTRRLAELLQQVDIRVLDYIVVAAAAAAGACVSFAQRGLL